MAFRFKNNLKIFSEAFFVLYFIFQFFSLFFYFKYFTYLQIPFFLALKTFYFIFFFQIKKNLFFRGLLSWFFDWAIQNIVNKKHDFTFKKITERIHFLCFLLLLYFFVLFNFIQDSQNKFKALSLSFLLPKWNSLSLYSNLFQFKQLSTVSTWKYLVVWIQ